MAAFAAFAAMQRCCQHGRSVLRSKTAPAWAAGAAAAARRWFASKKHKKFVKFAKGYRGRANRCFRIAVQKVEKGWQHAYRSRKLKKRDMRSLWISRINSGTRMYGIPYNRFIRGLHTAKIELNRKVLAQLASTEPYSFRSVVEVTRAKDPYLAALSEKPRSHQ